MLPKLHKDDVDLSRWEYQYQQRGEQPISLCDLFCRSLERYFFTEIDAPTRHTNYLFTDSFKGYFDPSSKEYIAHLFEERSSNRAVLREIIRKSIDIPRSFSVSADMVSKAALRDDLSNEELISLWNAMDEGFMKVIPWFYYPWYLSKDNYVTDKVARGLKKHEDTLTPLCPLDEALLVVVFPLKKTGFQLEQFEMLKLVSIAENDLQFATSPVFREAAQEYLRKFDWLTTFILTPALPMNYEQLVERVTRARNESFKETFAVQQEASEKNERLAAQIIELIQDDQDLIEDIADARELCYVLTAGIEEAFISSARHLPFMQIVAQRIGVEFEDSKHLLSYEVVEALRSGAQIDPALIRERQKGFVMMIRDGVQSVCFGEEGHAISQWIDQELTKVDTSVTELRGQIACKGNGTGRVRIALSPEQAHELQEGEVLVCPMTNPDYVPAMRRACAIVTDEGGLLSHAAIMSREFGKPCVIATKSATKVLVTGDLVEVDAQHGLVRILEKVGT